MSAPQSSFQTGAKATVERVAAGVSGFMDWLVGGPAKPPASRLPYQGPSPEGLPLLVVRIAGQFALDDEAMERASVRLREGGYHAGARNFGALRCLHGHEHGADGRCILTRGPKGDEYYVRCFGNDEDALRQLLLVARARGGRSPVLPPCPACRASDARADEQSGWAPCAACWARRFRELQIAAEQDPALRAARNARDKLKGQLASKPWFRGIGIGRDNKSNATIEVRVSKLTPRIKRSILPKVRDENGAWIAVNVEQVGDIVAQKTELGGYRSMEIHSKAPPPDGDARGALDDLGRAEELGELLRRDAEPDREPAEAAPRRSTDEFVDDKVQELAAAWAGLRERMRKSPTLKRVLDPLHRSWEAFWATWQAGSGDGLEGAIEATNAAIAGATAEQAKEELAALKARAQTHNLAVQEALRSGASTDPGPSVAGPIRDEPEFQQYAKRWKAWVDKLKAAIERSESTWSSVKDIVPFGEDARLSEVRALEAEFNLFLTEWETLKLKIGVRKGAEQIDRLQTGVSAFKKVRADQATDADKDAAAAALAEAQRVKDAAAQGKSTTTPDLPRSAATQAPLPPTGPSAPTPGLFNLTTGKLVGLGAAGTVVLLGVLKTLIGR